MAGQATVDLGHGVAGVASQVLSEVVSEGIFATGGQLAVVCDGELVVDVAVGDTGWGERLFPDHLHNVYCLLKPLPYLLLGRVLEDAGCGPDDVVDEVVELPSWCPNGLTYRQLCCHDAGLGEPLASVWRMTPVDRRPALLNEVTRSSGPTYSEFAGGLIAEHVIEQLSGRAANVYCVDELLGPLGLVDDIIVGAGRALAAHGRVSVPVSGLPVAALPMLSELLPCQMGEVRLAFGALATMRGAAQLFAAVGRVMEGDGVQGLPTPGLLNGLLDEDRPFRYDPVLGRDAKWAGGFMVGLAEQGISRLAGVGSVAHAGGLANSAALYDPARRVSVAVFLNGVGAGFHDMALPRQQALDAVLDAISTV